VLRGGGPPVTPRLFDFLEREGVLLHNPTLDLELPSWRLLPRAVINQDQAKRLVAHPDPHTSRGMRSRAILELLYETGIRVSECERLDVSDVDLAQGVLFVRDGKGRRGTVSCPSWAAPRARSTSTCATRGPCS
jgi:site-specific recombinase XerD